MSTDLYPACGAVAWSDPARAAAFERWLARVAPAHGLRPETLRPASADASFRRYFRIDCDAAHGGGTRIVMDAPPAHEDSRPFVRVAGLMREAGVRAPEVLAWDEADGFLLLTDLGTQTLLQALDPQQPDAALPYFKDAIAALVAWQRASRPGVLPPYDEALLRRELALFPDWYLARHKGITLSEAQRRTLEAAFDLIVQRVLAQPTVWVHRDYMPRNLMLPAGGFDPSHPEGRLGVLDFQDAVHGPLTYDIASLMRDAFLSWDEEVVLDVTIRYWEAARKAGLLDAEGWAQDFGAFYRAVEWMGLQRHLKVAGIFARLTLRDGKPKYLADAPRFIAYIRHTAARYRELKALLQLIDAVEGIETPVAYAFGRPWLS
ncbi:Phosphotransferase enzyme family protein [Tepidimonas alkaliphilus]|uniref:Phosphotransferase enzyme family protein n=1 Tax=Tepidimonas alkaliphilus TaxID=2588942 RepID=A0A554W810_9BURK|nr:phosphotransferase [Tepidimonas alkaliphilus]TSE19709.1 Phosphotransferase enzyme family protein [Tepidimonas alkaliphilus]